MKYVWNTPRTRFIAGTIVVLATGAYLFFTYTSLGRITGMYAVGGLRAPWSVQSECRTTARNRVETLFTLPLMMNTEAKSGLREYWHHSYYRECLFREGYSFTGAVLPQSTLYRVQDTESWYVNPLAGVSLHVPPTTQIVRDNELDVTFDDRLMRSELQMGSTTVFLDTYNDHDFVKTFADLPQYIDHYTTGTSTVVRYEYATTTRGIPYITVEESNNICGVMTVTVDEQILHLFAPCSEKKRISTIVDTLTITSSISVY